MGVRTMNLQHLRSAAIAIAALGFLPSCVATGADEEEPWEAETEEDRGAQAEIGAAPNFQLPFPCGQSWIGQTRTAHSPQNAIDFNRTGDEGDTVVAAASGRVSRVENLGNTSYGRWIEINHGNGYTTRYAHLSSQVVRAGQQVSRGQKIGTVGNTGGSFGAHLHYEQRRNGLTQRVRFDGAGGLYFGSRTYKSDNCTTSGGGGGGDTTSGAAGRIDTPSGVALTIRSGPGTGFAAIGSVADGTRVSIRCQQTGQRVTGTFGTSSLWDKIGTGYVSDAYVYTGVDGRVAADCP
jgi:hypothetical protein